ncbi:MAG: thermonuclease family protein, partial [Candidatus Uhrbacteria bacterium]|nr:thermonuclease family protein [Candidatus Uhrbacteria bacterium]
MRPAPLALALLLFAAACAPVAPTDGTPQSNAPPAQDEPTATAPPAVTGSPTPSALDQALVVRVVDGDTIDVLIGGEQLRVRYIGIDTPETVDPRRPVGCFGKEASARNRELVEGKTVALEKDVSETDRFGRLLRYVWLDPSTGSRPDESPS